MYILEENMRIKSNIEDELIDSFTWDKLYKELFVGFEFINLSDHKDLVFMCTFLLNKYICNYTSLY